MAKRTNKTNHVLSLLSGSEEKKENKKVQDTNSNPPVDPESSVSVIDSVDEEAQLADTIRKSLETEMENEADSPTTETIEVAEPEAEEKKAETSGVETLGAETLGAELDVEELEENRKESQPDLEEAMTEALKLELDKETAEEAGTEQEEEKAGESQSEPIRKDVQKTQEECDDEEFEKSFAFVNVMERLVAEKVVNYMEQFGVCTCSHCKADVTALALTKLPPKYVVVNKAAVSPLINFYSNKYAGQITVEITKACIRVNETPHHNRE